MKKSSVNVGLIVGVSVLVLLLAVGGGVVAVLVLAPPGGGPSPIGGTFEIDTVTFELDQGRSRGGLSGIDPPSSGPGIRIDTNTELRGLYGGTVKSTKPYAIGFDATDSAGDMDRLEFTRIEVTYNPDAADAAIEPAVEALELPRAVGAREIKTVNSGTGGRIIRSTVRVFSGEFAGVITRDEPFRLVIEGRFITQDGTDVPFTIDQYWEPRFERATRPAGEVLQDK
ncbi:MAG: hypothetical protein RIE32_04065 [Phycisphaerales bacterium]